jgi:hypothetical protein
LISRDEVSALTLLDGEASAKKRGGNRAVSLQAVTPLEVREDALLAWIGRSKVDAGNANASVDFVHEDSVVSGETDSVDDAFALFGAAEKMVVS